MFTDWEFLEIENYVKTSRKIHEEWDQCVLEGVFLMQPDNNFLYGNSEVVTRSLVKTDQVKVIGRHLLRFIFFRYYM